MVCVVPAQAGVGEPRTPRELAGTSCVVLKIDSRRQVLYRRGVSCSFARRWVVRMSASGGRARPAGWSCSSGSGFRSGGYCERGGKHFGWDAGD
jgi:hypothetical protein